MNQAITAFQKRPIPDPDALRVSAGLLPHEMSHSWNGKYRRPAGLSTSDYQQPIQGELLWVYEGLTQYLGNILTPRSGLITAADYHQIVAKDLAELDQLPGRQVASAGRHSRWCPVALFGTWRPAEPSSKHRFLSRRCLDLVGSRREDQADERWKALAG